ncbi:MAG: heavy metal sensor histidine kinase [Gammaproteobacteria bacterium]|nr:heavy metal sensor histidine kinase [Gammaproteobacteria bacterium]
MNSYKLSTLSLTLRLMIFAGSAIGLSLIISVVLVQESVKNHFAEQDFGELLVVTGSVERWLDSIDGNMRLAQDALSNAVSGHHGVYFRVDADSGEQLFLSQGGDFLSQLNHVDAAKSTNKTQLKNWQLDDGFYRGLATEVSVDGQSYRVIAAMDMSFHKQFLDKFTIKMWLMMLAIGVITIGATWLGIYQGYRPLKMLSKQIRNIQTHQLDERLNLDILPKELRNLAISFNEMLQHLEGDFERLSNFSADIAHELRTPLTNIITQTQVGLAQTRSLNEYQELLYSNLEEQERLAKMVSEMLWLAQSDNNLIKPVFNVIDLNSEVNELFEFFDALATEHQINLVLIGEKISMHADRALLRRAFSNLLSNAIRHTPPGSTIQVVISQREKKCVEIDFINPGKPISSHHLSRVFDRFYQVDKSRSSDSQGAGLGLAITKAIIDTHGGQITVASDSVHTVFTVRMPV